MSKIGVGGALAAEESFEPVFVHPFKRILPHLRALTHDSAENIAS